MVFVAVHQMPSNTTELQLMIERFKTLGKVLKDKVFRTEANGMVHNFYSSKGVLTFDCAQ
jgi:hypothetical protein